MVGWPDLSTGRQYAYLQPMHLSDVWTKPTCEPC